MPVWLSDPPRSLYVILIVATVLPFAAAIFFVGAPMPQRDKTKPKKKFSRRHRLIALSAVFGLLLAGLYTCDRLLMSDRKQIEHNLQEMSEGVKERNMDKIFRHISDKFRYGSVTDKKRLQFVANNARQSGQVDEFPIWDVVMDPISKETNEVNVQFRFKVTGENIRENHFFGRTIFVREADGQWRATTFHVYPGTGTREEFTIPGLP
jgi:hypothetical protein